MALSGWELAFCGVSNSASFREQVRVVVLGVSFETAWGFYWRKSTFPVVAVLCSVVTTELAACRKTSKQAVCRPFSVMLGDSCPVGLSR